MLAWDALSELGAYRITEIPRRPESGAPSHHRPTPATLGGPSGSPPWSPRTTPGRKPRATAPARWPSAGSGTTRTARCELLAAGPGLVGSDAGQEVFLALPGGARARPLGRGALTGLLARLPAWRAIAGISDGLLPGDERHAAGRQPPSLEECLLAAWPGPFGWLLVAEPLSAAEIFSLAEELAQRGAVRRRRF